jgi:UDP-3-O-[3-hydroxymyristoyl] glucosamine N-acyltransferase
MDASKQADYEQVAKEFVREVASVLQNDSILRPTAILLGSNIFIGKGCVIADGVIIYDNTVIGDYSYVGPYSVLGIPRSKDGKYDEATIIEPESRIGSGVTIENGCIVKGIIDHKKVIKRDSIIQKVRRRVGKKIYTNE